MKRFIRYTVFSCVVVFLFIPNASAFKKKVALLPLIHESGTRITTAEESILNGTLRNGLTSSDKYEALTRSDISSILDEYSFQSLGFVSDQQRVSIGSMSGADCICLSKVTKEGDFCYLEASIIDITSGLISSTASNFFKVGRESSYESYEQAMKSIVEELVRFDDGFIDDSLLDLVDGVNPIPFALVEKKPSFFGCDANAFSLWVNENLRYPEIAKENGIQGKVTVVFTISKEGIVTDVIVLRGVDPSLDKEAVRVVSSSPRWKPGQQRNNNVKVTYTFPIIFQLK